MVADYRVHSLIWCPLCQDVAGLPSLHRPQEEEGGIIECTDSLALTAVDSDLSLEHHH